MTVQLKEELSSISFERYYLDANGWKQGQYSIWDANQTHILETGMYTDDRKVGELIRFNNDNTVSYMCVCDTNGLMLHDTVYVYNNWNSVLVHTIQTTYAVNADNTVVETDYRADSRSAEAIMYTNAAGIAVLEKTTWHTPSNNKASYTCFHNGKANGTHLHMWPDGTVKTRMNYVDSKLIGPKEEFFLDGSIHTLVSYDADGLAQGQYVAYFCTGVLHKSGIYTNNVKTGEWCEYYANGNLLNVTTYNHDGKHDGIMVNFFSDGAKRQEIQYYNGWAHGTRKEWDPFGVLLQVECYVNGVLFGEQKLYTHRSTRLRAHYMHLADGEKILARTFMQDLGIPYSHLANPSEEEKVMITLALGDGALFCDSE